MPIHYKSGRRLSRPRPVELVADSSGPQSLHANDCSIPGGAGMAGRHTDNISTACKIHEPTWNPWNTTELVPS